MSFLKHHYGPNIHIVQSPYISGILADLCSPETFQPRINRLVEFLYSELINLVLEKEFPIEAFSQPTRMTKSHPEIQLTGHRLKRTQRSVVVNLARAGTYPSHICYDRLHYALPYENIRQDHIFASRITEDHTVVGTNFGAAKIGGAVNDALVIIPDPMGATGNTIISAIDFYKNKVEGTAKRYIAMHLIVTPEYLKKVTQTHPDVSVYALRVDRGLSAPEVLASEPGLYWDKERGLNEFDYIVPGGGGFGEVMNNSFV